MGMFLAAMAFVVAAIVQVQIDVSVPLMPSVFLGVQSLYDRKNWRGRM